MQTESHIDLSTTRPLKILVCDPQPVTAAGLRALLDVYSDEFLIAESARSLVNALSLVRENEFDVLMMDKSFGLRAISEWLVRVRECAARLPRIIVWGATISQADTLHLLRAGVRGVLRKTSEISALEGCLRAVAVGRVWIEQDVFNNSQRAHLPHVLLTPRELEVLELVEQGLRNKEIALMLGIQPGTVKIHVKHIFEKTGVRGRNLLAVASILEAGTNQQAHAQAAA